MCLTVYNLGNSNNTPVIISTAAHTANQQWKVEDQGDGTYKIYAYAGQNSFQMLDNFNGVTTNGNPVATWEDNGGVTQHWYLQDTGSGWYRIVPANAQGTAQTVQVVGGSSAQVGAGLEISTYTGGDNQVFRLDWAGVAQLLPSPKKGLGGYSNKQASLHTAWYYNWGGGESTDAPSSIEFVPMAWGYYGGTDPSWLQWAIGQPGVKTILAYNEPDNATQSNLTVSYALQGYQVMAGLGVPVGSPACVHADDQWMQDFMAGAAANGYRVDYVTIHWYGGNDANGFLSYVDSIHNLYGKPVWITEFCPADWSGNHGISAQQTADFLRVAIPGLNNRSYVQRYAWYSDGTGGTLGNGALFNDDGTLTDLGKLFARF